MPGQRRLQKVDSAAASKSPHELRGTPCRVRCEGAHVEPPIAEEERPLERGVPWPALLGERLKRSFGDRFLVSRVRLPSLRRRNGGTIPLPSFLAAQCRSL